MEPVTASFASAYRGRLRAPTQGINEILAISKDYQLRLGRALGLNASDLAVLELLMIEGALSPTDLAKRIGLSPAAMTTIVDRLAALGHVQRSRHPTDRRVVLVAATEESVTRAVDDVLPVALAVDGVLDEFDAAEQAIIARYLDRVAEVHRSLLPEF